MADGANEGLKETMSKPTAPLGRVAYLMEGLQRAGSGRAEEK